MARATRCRLALRNLAAIQTPHGADSLGVVDRHRVAGRHGVARRRPAGSAARHASAVGRVRLDHRDQPARRGAAGRAGAATGGRRRRRGGDARGARRRAARPPPRRSTPPPPLDDEAIARSRMPDVKERLSRHPRAGRGQLRRLLGVARRAGVPMSCARRRAFPEHRVRRVLRQRDGRRVPAEPRLRASASTTAIRRRSSARTSLRCASRRRASTREAALRRAMPSRRSSVQRIERPIRIVGIVERQAGPGLGGAIFAA